jgi:protease-4
MKLKEWQKIVLIIVVSFIFAYFVLRFFSRGLSEGPPPITSNSYLELVIAGELPERTAEDPFLEAIDEVEITSIQNILQAIRKAKIDPKIKGIVLRPFAIGAGWAKTEEIRNALLNFKASGKPLYAYLDVAGNKEYYIASTADSLVALSTGLLFINGFASEPVFIKEMLDKLGIEADFIAHGEYKNAPDMFTRENISEAQREVINSILDQYYANFVSSLAKSRGLEAAEVRQHIDRGLYSLEQAWKLGYVDTLMYYNEFKDHLERQDDEKSRFVSLRRYQHVPYSQLGISARETIAVVYGVGTIVIGGESQFGQGGLITSEGMANSIRKAAADKSVKAIILRIDSPGGSGMASDVIWREVVEAREEKPVIVSISDVAASGGYYISMAADTIVAHPNSIVGSIGVFAGKFAINKLYEKIGVNKEKIYRGRNADLFSETQKFTPEQREMIRQYIMDFYRDFISKAAQGRSMTPEAVDDIARGRVWTGEQGLENGLVDVLGGLHTAVQIAKELSGIPEDEAVRLRTYPRLKTLLERLLDSNITVRAMDIFSNPKEIPAVFRNIIMAMPYFYTGEPLYLYLYSF